MFSFAFFIEGVCLVSLKIFTRSLIDMMTHLDIFQQIDSNHFHSRKFFVFLSAKQTIQVPMSSVCPCPSAKE